MYQPVLVSLTFFIDVVTYILIAYVGTLKQSSYSFQVDYRSKILYDG